MLESEILYSEDGCVDIPDDFTFPVTFDKTAVRDTATHYSYYDRMYDPVKKKKQPPSKPFWHGTKKHSKY